MSETTVHTARLDLRPLGAEGVEALSHWPDGAMIPYLLALRPLWIRRVLVRAQE